MTRRSSLLSAAFAVSLCAGCGYSMSASTGFAAGYSWEIRGARGQVSTGHADTFSAAAGSNRASVKGGRLTVNGKSYGRLAPDDSVLVSEDGSVSVNDQPREPQPQ